MSATVKTPPGSVLDWELPVARLPSNWLASTPVGGEVELEHACFGHLKLIPDDTVDPAEMTEEILLTLGNERITLRWQRSVVAPLLRRTGILADRVALQEDASLAALVVEHLLTPAIEQAERALGLPIRILAVRAARARISGAAPTLRLKAVSSLWLGVVHLEILAASADADRLLRKALGQLVSEEADQPLDLPTWVTLTSPGFALPLAELKALCVGDALMLDSRWSPHDEVVVRLSPSVSATASWSFNRLTLADVPRKGSGKEHAPMTQLQTDDAFTVEDLPVTLTLELDRIEVPFATVAGLKAGSVLSFDTPLPETVRVLANGRPFATAGLVQIDGRLGIRITALAARSA